MIYVSVRVRGCRPRMRERERKRAGCRRQQKSAAKTRGSSRAQKARGRSGATTNDPSPAQSCSAAICRWDDAKLRIRSATLGQCHAVLGLARGTAFYPVPSCLYLESQFMTDSLAIRVAMVLILVPFSVQSKICKIDSIKY